MRNPISNSIPANDSMNLRVISCLTSGRISGVDTFAIHLTEQLRGRGIDARIMMTHPDKIELDRLPLSADVPIDTLNKDWRSKRRYRRRALRRYLESLAPCIYIPNYDYDHSPISATLPSTIQTVGILHSDDPMHYDHLRLLGRFWNAVVAVSPQIADVARQLDVPHAMLHTIPYGVPCDPEPVERAPLEGRPLEILYVGRIEQSQKRVLDMLKILDRLAQSSASVRLTMVGDGPERPNIEKLAQAHITSGRLRLLGTRPNAEMPDLYRSADVFLLTSAFEGLPVSLLEAMATGCIPVVTDVRSGVPSMIRPGESGFTHPIGAIDAFVRQLEAMAHSSAEERRRLASAAHATVRDGAYSLPRMVDRYADLFESLAIEQGAGTYVRPKPYFGELYGKAWQCRIERNIRRLTGRKDYLRPR